MTRVKHVGNQPRYLSEIPQETDEILLKKINPGARMRADYGDLADLKVSLKEKGLIQPIAVMKYEKPYEGYEYFLLAGGRRLKAMLELEWEKGSARIYPHGLDALEIRQIELEENIRRKDMNDAEKLKATKQIHDLWVKMYGPKTSTAKGAKGHSLRDTAERLGISPSLASMNVELGEWLEEMPELAKLGSASDIRKAIKSVKKEVKREQQLKEYEEEVKDKEEKELFELYKKCYIVGDFFERVRNVPRETIDLIDLDIDYPVEIEEGRVQHVGAQNDRRKGIYSQVTKEEFPATMQKTFLECFRVLKQDSWMIVWFGWEYHHQLQQWAKQAGFKTSFYTGKWYKGAGYAHTSNPYYILGHATEPFFYFKKGSPQISVPHADVYECPPNPPEQRVNPFEKPVKLMRSILDTFINPGSRILVPYAGSGNTLLAGIQMKCHVIGFDKSQQYRDGYISNLIKEVKGE